MIRIVRAVCRVMAIGVTWVAFDSIVIAQDDVVFRKNGIVTRGRILSSDASGVKIRLESGKDTFVPIEQVDRIDIKLTADQKEGDRLFEQKQFSAAAAKYEAALQVESRPWLRAKLAANIVACYSATGDVSAAINAFFTVSQAADVNFTWSSIPIWWLPEAPTGTITNQATTMLRSGIPIQQVIGASLLLGTSESQAARDVLSKLTTYPDERIGQLARTQLWRWDGAKATANDVASWQRQAAKLPADLRAGPYFAIGLALKRLGRYEEAALAFLWPALVDQADQRLARRAALGAAESLEQAKQPSEARQIYEEVAARFSGTPEATTAQARLAVLKE